MSRKTIKLNSGGTIERIPVGPHDEYWEMHNQSYSLIYVTLDISQSTGCTVKGHGREVEVTEVVAPQERKVLFYIQKSPPFKFKVSYDIREELPSIEAQRESIQENRLSLKDLVKKMRDHVMQMPFEVMDPYELEEAMRKLGYKNFVDPAFPPDESSIYDKTNEPNYPLDEVAVWKRPCEFMKTRPVLFKDSIDPNDIKQGALGNCWFLAAISSLAENPDMVNRLFITKEYNEFGIYRLRICKNGEWIVVTVDDYIPCTIKGGPMFTSGNGDELWVLLLEKAYAKVHRNYCQLRAGFLSDGMMDLSGCPTYKYTLPENREYYRKIKDYADDLWTTLMKADGYGHNMCAETPGTDMWTEGGGPDQESGIVPGHAYSVIQVKEYENIRLLNIRNPWGSFEWGGEWCDFHENWTPEIMAAIQPKFDKEDGSFWMSYEDFFKHFEGITI